MTNESRKDLADFRLKQAKECLNVSEMLANQGHYKDSANRSYYAIFHSMRAVLALDGFDSKKHSGIISAFRQGYIKTGIFDSTFSDVIGIAFEVRNNSDYEDFYILSLDSLTSQIEGAKSFLAAVEKYISQFM